jgi:hypothetical protein
MKMLKLFNSKFQQLILFVFFISISNAQIHRASSQNNYQVKYDSNFTLQYFLKKINHAAAAVDAESTLQRNESNSRVLSFLSLFDNLYYNMDDTGRFVWATSIIGTFLVGVCGVLPVFLLPQLVHDHHKLTDSPSFKYLVSFAAGSLLGDVFLHLLPEAFSAKSINFALLKFI